MPRVLDATSFAQGGNATKESVSQGPINSQFNKMVVLDVVSDPSIITDSKADYWATILGVVNIDHAKILPRNTIIAAGIGHGNNNPFFVFPFFPSHLALPAKPGETVWTFKENPNDDNGLMYWISKVVMPHYVDDVNHQHNPRVSEQSFFPGLIETAQNEIAAYYELRNGPVKNMEDGTRRTSIKDAYLILRNKPEEEIFERLLTFSDAGKISNWESVPRFKKRPGDIALEGSNNSLIVLGTDRTGPVANFETLPIELEYGMFQSPVAGDMSGFAGSIDLVVGRGQTQTTGGKVVDTTTIIDAGPKKSGTPIKKEIAKSESELEPLEGDPDFRYDSSRVQISQRTMPDTNFGLSSFNAEFSTSDTTTGDAAVVIKTDKMRIIARSDVEILVTNFDPLTDPQDPAKPAIKNQKDNTDDWAAIVIKTNGDIVFRPSKLGYIKLGSDQANKAIMCGDTPAIQTQGQVSSSPIFSTGNDLVCTSASGQGTFAKKVLVD